MTSYGAWTVAVVSPTSNGESVQPWPSRELAEYDFRCLRDAARFVTAGKLIDPAGKVVASFKRG
jgi:hypothetical protein